VPGAGRLIPAFAGGVGAFEGVPSTSFVTLVRGRLIPCFTGEAGTLPPGTLVTENGDCLAVGAFLIGGVLIGVGFFKLNDFKI